jgi:hypothetical protein
MRTSFHHQSEAQPPNFPARRTGQPQYPIYRDPTEPGFFDTFLCTVSSVRHFARLYLCKGAA